MNELIGVIGSGDLTGGVSSAEITGTVSSGDIHAVVTAEPQVNVAISPNPQVNVSVMGSGIQGETGKGLEFDWKGKKLGVRVEGDTDFSYTDLQAVDSAFIYEQIGASKVWNITHDLKKYPSVTVVDSAGTVVTGEIEYISLKEIKLTFTAEFSGKAYLN